MLRNILSTVTALFVIAVVQLAPAMDSPSSVVTPASDCVSAYRGLPDEDPTVVYCGRTQRIDVSDDDAWSNYLAQCLIKAGAVVKDDYAEASTEMALGCEHEADLRVKY